MGSRKRNSANANKELRKDLVSASLNNCPTSPRKMRLIADQIRGKKIDKAHSILKFSPKHASNRLEKLLLSAINNWQQKNPESDIENENIVVSEIRVDSAGMLIRLRPAPQGRAHRIRKRSNHVTMVLDSLKEINK